MHGNRQGRAGTTGSAFADAAQPVGVHDPALDCFVLVARFLGVPADPAQIHHDRGRGDQPYSFGDLVRIARKLGPSARTRRASQDAFAKLPVPVLIALADGGTAILLKINDQGETPRYLVQHADAQKPEIWSYEEMARHFAGEVLVMTSRERIAGEKRAFDVSWFIPALVKYRRPLRDVLVGSFFLQLLGLVSPIFFQLVIDKVLAHQSLTTLEVLAFGLAAVLIFETILSGLRTWLFAHTTNRVDAELSANLFRHLIQLPLSYFEARRVGDSVARVRELENIRQFLTSNAVTLVIDLFFTIVFFAVMYLYSPMLTLVVALTIPLYVAISVVVTPILRARLDEKFKRGAENQSFLVETVSGIGTLKSMAVEPRMRDRWERQFAGYVKTGFDVTTLANWGSHAIQLVSKLSTVAILFFGAKAVIAGDLSVGALVAFNMLAGRVAQAILRLSQLWQDFQQLRISIDRLGDILNALVDPAWLRRQVGVVLQENILFNRSVRENIALADPTMAMERVIHAAQLAGAHDFVIQLPHGYDTVIEERGANLSGGQRRRLAIARGRTVIIIAHRRRQSADAIASSPWKRARSSSRATTRCCCARAGAMPSFTTDRWVWAKAARPSSEAAGERVR